VHGLARQRGVGIGPVLRDVDLTRHHDLHRIEAMPVRDALGAL
jgi:hypothetical protein